MGASQTEPCCGTPPTLPERIGYGFARAISADLGRSSCRALRYFAWLRVTRCRWCRIGSQAAGLSEVCTITIMSPSNGPTYRHGQK